MKLSILLRFCLNSSLTNQAHSVACVSNCMNRQSRKEWKWESRFLSTWQHTHGQDWRHNFRWQQIGEYPFSGFWMFLYWCQTGHTRKMEKRRTSTRRTKVRSVIGLTSFRTTSQCPSLKTTEDEWTHTHTHTERKRESCVDLRLNGARYPRDTYVVRFLGNGQLPATSQEDCCLS